MNSIDLANHSWTGSVTDIGTKDCSNLIRDIIKIQGYVFSCIRELNKTDNDGSSVERKDLKITSIKHLYSNENDYSNKIDAVCPFCERPIFLEGSRPVYDCIISNDENIKETIATALELVRVYAPPEDLCKPK